MNLRCLAYSARYPSVPFWDDRALRHDPNAYRPSWGERTRQHRDACCQCLRCWAMCCRQRGSALCAPTSNRVHMMEPTTVTALNGMEKRGYVRRVRNAEDRRKVNVFLTRKGRSLRDKLLPYAIEVNRFATEGVSEDDLENLRATLRRMRDRLQAEND